MLGPGGCRLGKPRPEIAGMQAEAIFKAAGEEHKEGISVQPEVAIPLVSAVQKKIYADSPFQTLDKTGVGELVKIALERWVLG